MESWGSWGNPEQQGLCPLEERVWPVQSSRAWMPGGFWCLADQKTHFFFCWTRMGGGWGGDLAAWKKCYGQNALGLGKCRPSLLSGLCLIDLGQGEHSGAHNVQSVWAAGVRESGWLCGHWANCTCWPHIKGGTTAAVFACGYKAACGISVVSHFNFSKFSGNLDLKTTKLYFKC